MENRPFETPPETERELARLEERLRDAEDEIRSLSESQKRMALLLEALRTNVENGRFAQHRLEAELARHENAIRDGAARTREILESRIWRSLVRAGSFLLRIQQKAGAPRQRPATVPVLPAPPPLAARAAPPPVLRASASRYAQGPMTTEQWKQVIIRAAASRPKGTSGTPRISIITPLWNTEVPWLAEAAISVLEQTCADWEWCLVDDGSTRTDFHALLPVLESMDRIKILRLESGRGISGATNEGLRMASGEFVCFLDHDDMLAPTALAECLDALDQKLPDQKLDAVYTDSDKVDVAGTRREPFYKPDWSPEYFRGVMYVGHLLCVRRNIALKIGGFEPRYDGVQDFEFMLRYSEQTQRIGHLSAVLYHWRAVPHSVAASTDAKGDLGKLQKDAVQAHLERLHLPATAEAGSTPHRVRIAPVPAGHRPKISIIIPTRDAPELLYRCLSSIVDKTTYDNYEIVCVDNETTSVRALNLMRTYPVKRLLFPGRFNFARANNLGVRRASGEFLVFMNNDVEVITEDWIEEMLYYARQNDVGAVGGLLLYADRTVQHAGVVLGCRGTADHVLRNAPADSDGYAGSLACAREVSAVTAACMMLERKKFEQTGGFIEYYHTVYQDVDLCLELRSRGFRNIFAPRARFFHLESRSRGTSYDFIDRNLLLDRWAETIAASDPYYNRNLDVEACDYSLKSA